MPVNQAVVPIRTLTPTSLHLLFHGAIQFVKKNQS